MSRNQLTFILGLILVLIPFSGFPYSWKIIVYVAAGIILLCISILSYMKNSHYFKSRNAKSAVQSDSQGFPSR